MEAIEVEVNDVPTFEDVLNALTRLKLDAKDLRCMSNSKHSICKDHLLRIAEHIDESLIVLKASVATEDQAVLIVEALKAHGFTIIQNPITEKMETAAKQATGMGMYGYSMQSALDAMIEAQEQSHD